MICTMRANCLICGDLFDEIKTIVSAPCGHTFHDECLRQWIVESPTCPSCRKCVLLKNVIHLYFNFVEEDSSPEYLHNENSALKAKLNQQEMEAKKLQNVVDGLREFVKAAEDDAEKTKSKLLNAVDQVNAQKAHMKQMSKQLVVLETLREQNAGLKMQLKHMKNVDAIIDGTIQEVEEMVKICGEGPGSTKQMATYCAILKRELSSINESRNLLRTEVAHLRRELGCKVCQLAEKIKQLASLKQTMESLNETVNQLRCARASVEVNNEETGLLCIPSTLGRSESLTPKLSNPERESDFQNITLETYQATPSKKLKLNVVSSVVPKLSKTDEDATNKYSVLQHRVTQSLFRPLSVQWHDSIVQHGYDGLGGHTKFVNTTTKILANKTKTRKRRRSKENAKCSGSVSGSIHSFFG